MAEHIDQNIHSIAGLQRREWESMSPAQRRIERIGRFAGRPVYLVAILTLAVLWMGFNLASGSMGYASIDPFPFEALQGVLTLIALLTTTIVLIAQNRQAKLEQQHTHLGLQVNLLTEQKVTKLIDLIEELRRDLPMVKDRLDVQAEVLRERADTNQVISAIAEVGLTDDTEKPPLKDPARRDEAVPPGPADDKH